MGNFVSKIRRETVADRTTAELRQSILQSELPQGTPITEDAIAERLGVSRTTIRQALNTLLMEGLLTRHPTTRVLQVTTLTKGDVHDIYRARRFLELGGVDAATDAPPEQHDRLQQSIVDLRRATETDDVEAFVRADFDCHAAVVAFLGSRHLSETHTLLMSKLQIVIAQITMDKQDNLESLAIHEEFAKQILSGQLSEAHKSLAKRMDESEQFVATRAEED